MKNYLLYISVLTLVLSVIYYFVRDNLPYNTFYIIPAFFFITTISHILLMRSASAQGRSFATYFIAAMGFKMFAYLVFLAVMHMALGGIDMQFVMVFFVCYLVYTTFEMFIILPQARKRK